ncbi:MAG: hypothetical protein ACK4EX_00675 [Thermaurantimonas sp.]|uniref:hypothetical protein n=1 Tax=Thermaurantimonas sp. TaxID=2681568 RepID=UPI00391C11A8
MKNIFLFSFLLVVNAVFSQSIIGRYEQETANAPKGFKFSEEDVVVLVTSSLQKNLGFWNFSKKQILCNA